MNVDKVSGNSGNGTAASVTGDIANGLSADEIKKIFQDNKSWEPLPEHSYNEAKTNNQINYIMGMVKEGNYRYTRNALETKRICFSECPLIKEKDCRKLQVNEENNDSDYANFCDCKGRFKPALVAQWLKRNQCFKTDRKTEILYYYNQKTGCWDENGKSLFKNSWQKF